MGVWGSVNIGGSANKLFYVAAASYSALPSGVQANTIGIITSVPITNLYPSNETLTLVDGDVVLKQATTGYNRAINIAFIGYRHLYALECYQQQSGVLTRVDSFIHDGTSWSSLYCSFYELGAIRAIVADFVKYVFGGSTSTFTKSTDYMLFSQTTSTKAWVCSQNTVNVDNLKTLHFYAYSGASSSEVRVGISPSNTDATNATYTGLTNTAYADVTVDISAATGNQYIFFGAPHTFTDRSMRVQKIWAN